MNVQPYAYSECSSLTSIDGKIDSDCKRIGCFAFYKCSGLTGDLEIPFGVEVIEKSAFQEAFSGTNRTLTLPRTIKQIYQDAFANCPFTTINYYGTEQDKAKIFIGSGNSCLSNTWTYQSEAQTGDKFPGYNYSLREEVTGTEIHLFATLLRYTGSSSSVTVPDHSGDIVVDRIGSRCFKNNLVIESVTVPSTVAQIGSYCFEGCSNLATVTYHTGCILAPGVFRGCSKLATVTQNNS